jgi:hypothetical protein
MALLAAFPIADPEAEASQQRTIVRGEASSALQPPSHAISTRSSRVKWATISRVAGLSSTAEVTQISDGIAAAQRTGILGHYRNMKMCSGTHE